MLAVMCNQHIDSLYQQKSKQLGQFPILTIGINGTLMIFAVVNKVIGK
jgi:hypothetical protein